MADTSTNRWKGALRRAGCAPLAAMLAGLALAGCSGTHVGDDWQCPISQGAVCTSVAAADPAVPRDEPEARLALQRPLYEAPATAGNAASARVTPALPDLRHECPRPGGAGQARPCDRQWGPLAWLARLFAAHDGETDPDAASGTALPLSAGDPAAGDPAAGDPAVRDLESVDGPAPMQSATAAPSPAGPAGDDAVADDAMADDAGADDAGADDLRVPETLGRVWIGPFVDAGGLYREAAYVRVVIEPARWRLP